MVTPANAFTSVVPAKTAAAAPAKVAAPAKAAAPAKKVARKAVAKKVTRKAVAKKPVKKAAPVATAAVKKVVKPVVAKAAKAVVKIAAPAAPVVKAAVKAVAKPAAKPKAAKPVKEKKPKLVRDSFTIPKAEYSVLEELKQRAGKLGSSVKKSELLRAGIKALAAMADAALLSALKAVPAVKTGRPAKD